MVSVLWPAGGAVDSFIQLFVSLWLYPLLPQTVHCWPERVDFSAEVHLLPLQNRFHDFLEKMIAAWALIIWASTRIYIPKCKTVKLQMWQNICSLPKVSLSKAASWLSRFRPFLSSLNDVTQFVLDFNSLSQFYNCVWPWRAYSKCRDLVSSLKNVFWKDLVLS